MMENTCPHCSGLMVADRDDLGEYICTNCSRSTFVANPAPYKARNWERRGPRAPSMPQGTVSIRRFK